MVHSSKTIAITTTVEKIVDNPGKETERKLAHNPLKNNNNNNNLQMKRVLSTEKNTHN